MRVIQVLVLRKIEFLSLWNLECTLDGAIMAVTRILFGARKFMPYVNTNFILQKINLKVFNYYSLQSNFIILIILNHVLLDPPDRPLLVDVLHHGVGVGGQQVVHLVPQGSLTQ